MCTRRLLLIAAALLAAVHVIGVLFARPLWRPAELVAALCLLTCAIRYGDPAGSSPIRDGPGDGEPAGGGRMVWGLGAAAGVLVVGAALTVPPPGVDGGWRILSPEQYETLVRPVQLRYLAEVTAALLFVLLLLAMAVLRRRANRPGPGRVLLAAGIIAALVIIGYVVLRSAVIVTARPHPGESVGDSVRWLSVAAVLPLLLAPASLALAVTAVVHRQWRAAAGAALFVVAAVIWIDAAIGAVALPYQVREAAELFVLDLVPAADTVPQPTQALTAALHLTAAILTIAGRTRPVAARPLADDPRRDN